MKHIILGNGPAGVVGQVRGGGLTIFTGAGRVDA